MLSSGQGCEGREKDDGGRVEVNVNSQSAPHVDDNNVSRCKIIAFGDYSGREVWVDAE